MGNCKDGKCGIRGGNTTRAKRLEYAPDNSGVRQKFRIGETAYYKDCVYSEGRVFLKNPKIIFTPIVLGSGVPYRGSFIYRITKLNNRGFMQYNLFTRAEAEQKVAENPEIYSIQEAYIAE